MILEVTEKTTITILNYPVKWGFKSQRIKENNESFFSRSLDVTCTYKLSFPTLHPMLAGTGSNPL